MGYVLGSLEPGGNKYFYTGEWQIPDDWLTLPRAPDGNKAYFIIDTYYVQGFFLHVSMVAIDEDDGISEDVTVIIDWGDGTSSQKTFSQGEKSGRWDPEHTYTAGTGTEISDGTEQYEIIVTAVRTDIARIGVGVSRNLGAFNDDVLQVAIGENIRSRTKDGFGALRDKPRLKVAYLTNPEQFADWNYADGDYFFEDSSLVQFIHTFDITEIPQYAFYRCFGGVVSSLDLSKVKTVGDWAFAYCVLANQILRMPALKTADEYAFFAIKNLREFIAPNLASIGAYAFTGCEILQKVEKASDCVIGDSAFDRCVNYIQ